MSTEPRVCSCGQIGCHRMWTPTDNAAARASEAPGDAQSPTPDVGAAQDSADGSAAKSEPRDTVKRRILETLDRWHEVGADTTGEFAGVMEAVDDYAPAIRAQVADEITAHFAQERAQVADAEPVTLGGVHEQAKLLGRYDRVIATIDRIARGDQ
jgi:hypothetical protein